jgi:hypothetical protein
VPLLAATPPAFESPIEESPSDAPHEEPLRDAPVVNGHVGGATVPAAPAPLPEPSPILRLDERSAPALAPAEPTVERDEEGHASFALHPAAPKAEPEPEPEPELKSESKVESEFVSEPSSPVETEAPTPETAPAPAATPTPLAVAEPEDGEEERELPLRVVIVLDGEEDVEIGCYADEPAAEEAARDLIRRIARLEEWPRVGRRFIRPDRIVSLDIRERHSWTGSRSRAAWGEPRAEADAAPAAGTSIF